MLDEQIKQLFKQGINLLDIQEVIQHCSDKGYVALADFIKEHKDKYYRRIIKGDDFLEMEKKNR